MKLLCGLPSFALTVCVLVCPAVLAENGRDEMLYSDLDTLNLGIDACLAEFDAEKNLCLYRRPFHGNLHDTDQASPLLLMGLLLRNADGDGELAMRVMSAVAESPQTWNVGFRLFMLSTLASGIGPQAYPQPAEEFRDLLRKAIRDAAEEVAAREEGDIHRPGYTNFWLLDAAGMLLAGQFIQDDTLTERATRMLRQFDEFQQGYDGPEEFASPTYAPIQIAALSAAARFAQDAGTAELAQRLEKTFLEHVFINYNPETAVMIGPFSRAYPSDITGIQPILLAQMAATLQIDKPANWIREQLESRSAEAGTPVEESLCETAWAILWHLLPPVTPLETIKAMPSAEESSRQVLPPRKGTTEPTILVRESGEVLSLATVCHWSIWSQVFPIAVYEKGKRQPLMYQSLFDARGPQDEFYCRQEGSQAVVACGFNDGSKVTQNLAHLLRLPGVNAETRLYIDGIETPLEPRGLPPDTAIVFASHQWSIGFIFGAPTPFGGEPGIRLTRDGQEFSIEISHGRGERIVMRAGDVDELYAWYYVAVEEDETPAGAAKLSERLRQARVADERIDDRRRSLTVADGEHQIKLIFNPTIRRSRGWTSNGHEVYP